MLGAESVQIIYVHFIYEMTVIYETSTVKLEKVKDQEYRLTVQWEGPHKRFWINFPFNLLKVIGKSSPSAVTGRRVFSIRAKSIQTLPQLISREKGFLSYEQSISFLSGVGNQIQALERFDIGIPFVDEEDVLVVDDRNFFYVNDSRTIGITDGSIEITDPYKPNRFFSPEFRKIEGIPARISYRSAYYSLAALVTYSLTGKVINGNIKSKLLDPIYATKLFWALERCLEENPANRYYLII